MITEIAVYHSGFAEGQSVHKHHRMRMASPTIIHVIVVITDIDLLCHNLIVSQWKAYSNTSIIRKNSESERLHHEKTKNMLVKQASKEINCDLNRKVSIFGGTSAVHTHKSETAKLKTTLDCGDSGSV